MEIFVVAFFVFLNNGRSVCVCVCFFFFFNKYGRCVFTKKPCVCFNFNFFYKYGRCVFTKKPRVCFNFNFFLKLKMDQVI